VTDLIRNPAVAGMFYPKDPEALRGMLESFLSKADNFRVSPKALIAPHAGYIYSGQTAAKAYAPLKGNQNTIKRVVLLGPAHRYPLRGISVSEANYFETPLGRIPVPTSLREKALSFDWVHSIEAAFDGEHSLEVHLPFLQSVLKDFEILPLLVGNTDAEKVKALILALWGDEETLIVASSDLSHFHEYEEACQMDKKTADAIVRGDIQSVGYNDACGRIPVNGLLLAAKEKNYACELIDLCNSGDTEGDKNRVVGYGAFHFVKS
jgi:AmmeMemoRadiSam system protein B